MARAIAGTAVALVVFTALVLSGVMNGIDDWAIDHVMPALNPRGGSIAIVSTNGLWKPFPWHILWWQKLLDAYNYPASVLASGAILLAGGAVLARRREKLASLAWGGAWLVANVAELVAKHVITRPGVHWSNGIERIHVLPFDSSYPSGHTARSVVLAAFVAYVWPKLRWAAAAWLLLVPVALVIGADHTVSDVVGGTLLGLLLVLGAHATIRRWNHWVAPWRLRELTNSPL